jgi:hypothetical protein
MSLALIAQDDFAVGVLRGIAPDQQPGVGLHEIRNGLLDDDGDVYRRGGTVYVAGGMGGDPDTWIWTGYLNGAPVELVATAEWIFTFTGIAASATGGVAPGTQVAVIGDTIYFPDLKTIKWQPPANLTLGSWVPPSLPSTDLHLATIAGRLVVGAGNRIAFSEPETLTFIADDFHELPDGVIVKGLAAIQDTLLAFTNFGLWAVTNMAFNLTDDAGNIQQTLSLIVPELSLLHEGGLALWNGRVIAPCYDRVYMVDLSGPPTPISDSITPLYIDRVNQGYKPGLTKVWRNTLMLPMLDADDVVQDVLTCRLNRPIQGRYVYYPWTVIDGHAGQQSAFDISLTGSAPRLLGAGSDGLICDLTSIFDPDPYNGADADGSVHHFDIETRDFPTGTGQPNHFKRIRLRYTLEGNSAKVTALWQLIDGGAWIAFDEKPLEQGKGNVASWWLPAYRTRWARVRFECSVDTAPGDLTVHQIELSVRQANHAR